MRLRCAAKALLKAPCRRADSKLPWRVTQRGLKGASERAGAMLPRAVVSAAFEYAAATGVPLAGFLGDECVTLRMTPELEVLPLTSSKQSCWETGKADDKSHGMRCCRLRGRGLFSGWAHDEEQAAGDLCRLLR